MTNNRQNELPNEQASDALTHISDESGRRELIGTLWSGRYEIIEWLGSGGMGDVYKVRNRLNDQIRAIKILHQDFLSDRDAVRRFQNEVKAAQRISHNNVIQIIDDGIGDNQLPFLVMEYVQGQSLSAVLRNDISLESKLQIFQQICSALAAAHRSGVVHRDIKPSNVLIVDSVRGSYVVKVLDFGIAKLMPRSDDGTIAVTATGAVCGSPPYMSPEQCLGQQLDHRSDIYSLGCLMYEVLCGVPPFSGASQMSVMYKHLNEQPPSLKVPELKDIRLVRALDEVVRGALEKEPGRRYQTVEELAKQLASVAEKARQKSRLLSELEMLLRSVFGQYYNAVGSSRKVIILIATITLFLLVPFSLFIAPYIFVSLPKHPETQLNWKPSPRWSYCSFKTCQAFNRKRLEIEQRLAKPNTSDEKCLLLRSLADLFFDDSEYNEAALRYSQLAFCASSLIKTDPQGSIAMASHMHETAYALSRYSRCLLRKGEYKPALDEALLGRQSCFYDMSTDTKYQIFFSQVIGVASVMLTGKSTEQTNDYLEKFTKYIDDNGYAPEKASEIAIAFAEIGDSRIEAKQWDKAIEAYERARRLWEKLADPGRYNRTKVSTPARMYRGIPGQTVLNAEDDRLAAEFASRGDFAVYNQAIALAKIGRAQVACGQFADAKKSLESSITVMENWDGSKNNELASLFVQLMNIEYSMHDYLGAWGARINAVKEVKRNKNE